MNELADISEASKSVRRRPARRFRAELLLRIVLALSALLALGAAVYSFRTFEPFRNPIAYASHGESFYVVEKAGNTVLQLAIGDPGAPLELESARSIEPDEGPYYYMVRRLYQGRDGVVVHSYLYDKESKILVGYRFRIYRSLQEPPEELLTVFLTDQNGYPEIRYACDPAGRHYFVHDSAGYRCLWRMETGKVAALTFDRMPPDVQALGETNTDFSSWNGLSVGDDGHVYITSGADGLVNELSAEGLPIRKIGKVGFEEGCLLAPSELAFVSLGARAARLLTVASPGNRTWVQYAANGNVTRVLSPLKDGYAFPDAFVGPIYTVGSHRVPCAFDLANKTMMVIDRDYTTMSTYWVTHYGRSGLLVLLAAALSVIAIVLPRLRRFFRHLRFPFFLKLLLLFIPLLVASALVVGDWVKDDLSDDLLDEYVLRSASLAWAVANSLSLEELERIQAPEDRESKVYERVFRMLDRLVDTKNVDGAPKWILHKIHEGRFYYGINVWRGPIFEPFIVPRDRPMFFDVLQKKQPQSGIFTDDQGEWFSYLYPITNLVGEVIYVLELYRPTESLHRTYEEISQRVGAIIGVTVLAAVLLVLLFSYVFTRPLRLLAAATKRISAGEFDHQVRIRSRDELHDLSHSFNRMTLSLKKYTADLTRTTAANERYESELRFARDIQQELLPRQFPPYPGASSVEIFARMLPAREVGGDYYDFFLVDRDHMGALVADVAGKGAGAGLFMMRMRTLLRDNARGNLSAADTLKRVNQLMLPDNQSMMFTTMIYLICNLQTGRLVFCNAGHPPPLVLRKGSPEWLEAAPEEINPPLGIREAVGFKDRELTLAKGDSLILYTDGATEAVDSGDHLFGDQRLLECVKRQALSSNHEICDEIYRELALYQQGLEQFDDITMLFLKYLG
ncbi:MAG TPA: hypothetical protein DCZ95_05815 [Verrucomicrobia bacterium]|nr:MAG: hypothetical protein A2X46_09905 [Lentisphaerae bacterium GWF2_57_35]HBA83594.1 hypothetical protein [Verrucomicrobiota bacterium]